MRFSRENTLEEKKQRRKKQRERNRQKKRACRKLFVTDQSPKREPAPRCSTPLSENSIVVNLSELDNAAKSNTVSFTNWPWSVSPEVSANESYVQQKTLEWCDELDNARDKMKNDLTRLKNQAESALKEVKEKMLELRKNCKVIENMQEDAIATEEDLGTQTAFSQRNCKYFSIAQPTESLKFTESLETNMWGMEKHDVIKHVRKLEQREREALVFAKTISLKAETLEMELKSQRSEAEKTIAEVRQFWRDKVYSKHTRGGMMLMNSLHKTIHQFDSYLEDN